MKKKQLLTKLQRYTAYCIMLQKAEDVIKGERFKWDGILGDDADGMCWMILGMGIDSSGYYIQSPKAGCSQVIYNHFPELFVKTPSDDWPATGIPGWQFRREALIQCIKETHP